MEEVKRRKKKGKRDRRKKKKKKTQYAKMAAAKKWSAQSWSPEKPFGGRIGENRAIPRGLPEEEFCAERVARKTFRRKGRRKTGFSEVVAARRVLRRAGHQKNLSEEWSEENGDFRGGCRKEGSAQSRSPEKPFGGRVGRKRAFPGRLS